MRLHYKAPEVETPVRGCNDPLPIHLQVLQVPRGPSSHVRDACRNKEACLRMVGLIKCSIVPPEALPSRAPLPSESETHILVVSNVRPNL